MHASVCLISSPLRTKLNGFQCKAIATEWSILDIAGLPDLPLITIFSKVTFNLTWKQLSIRQLWNNILLEKILNSCYRIRTNSVRQILEMAVLIKKQFSFGGSNHLRQFNNILCKQFSTVIITKSYNRIYFSGRGSRTLFNILA